MSNRDHRANQPTHPVVRPEGVQYWGIDLRQHYAGLALQGLVARNLPHIPITPETADSYANIAFMPADAMVERSEK